MGFKLVYWLLGASPNWWLKVIWSIGNGWKIFWYSSSLFASHLKASYEYIVPWKYFSLNEKKICRIRCCNITTIFVFATRQILLIPLLQSHTCLFVLVLCIHSDLFWFFLFWECSIPSNIVAYQNFIFWELDKNRMVYGKFLSKWN